MTQKFNILLLILVQTAQRVNQMPISVPVEKFLNIDPRFPNAHYNRLPGNRFPIRDDPIYSNNENNNNSNNENSVTDDYEDYDEQTDKPVTNAQYTSINHNNYSPLLTESFLSHKRRRRRKKIRRPCIPIQSFNSQLFTNNRYRRDANEKESGKTLGLLFGGYRPFAYPPPIGTPFYGNYGQYPIRPLYDNVNPQNDDDRPQYGGNRPQYNPISTVNAPLYNPIGGYPCIPVSYGNVPIGGPFGFFGPGGLFDSGSSPSITIPQTVIVNRPPLFGNKPFYGNKPSYGNRPPSYGNRPQYPGDSEGSVSEDGQPIGFWGTVVDKLSQFVTSVNPQAVYTAIGDTLQGLGTAIQNAPSPVESTSSAVDSIRNGYREFASLIFR